MAWKRSLVRTRPGPPKLLKRLPAFVPVMIRRRGPLLSRVRSCSRIRIVLAGFDPLVAEWFATRFGAATEPQVRGWPEIRAGHDVRSEEHTSELQSLRHLGCRL